MPKSLSCLSSGLLSFAALFIFDMVWYMEPAPDCCMASFSCLRVYLRSNFSWATRQTGFIISYVSVLKSYRCRSFSSSIGSFSVWFVCLPSCKGAMLSQSRRVSLKLGTSASFWRFHSCYQFSILWHLKLRESLGVLRCGQTTAPGSRKL